MKNIKRSKSLGFNAFTALGSGNDSPTGSDAPPSSPGKDKPRRRMFYKIKGFPEDKLKKYLTKISYTMNTEDIEGFFFFFLILAGTPYHI
jgi:hypothetical protein